MLPAATGGANATADASSTTAAAGRVSVAVHRGHASGHSSGTSTPRSPSPASGSRAASRAFGGGGGGGGSVLSGAGSSRSALARYAASVRDIMVCNIPHAAKLSLGVSVFYATCSVSLSMVRSRAGEGGCGVRS